MRNLFLVIFFTLALSAQAQRSDFKEIDFARADYIAELHQGEELYNLPGLVHGLTTSLNTDVEKFRSIYYWVCHNIRGEYQIMRKNNKTRKKLLDNPQALDEWNAAFRKEMFTKLLHEKETLCTGYAYLVKELANMAGLECEIIHGYGPGNQVKKGDLEAPNHSWNAVKLNGKWYLCDATWSAGIIDMNTFLFEFDYDDTFFLMKPEDFAKTHRPEDDTWSRLQQESTNSQVSYLEKPSN